MAYITSMDFYDLGIRYALHATGLIKEAVLFSDVLLPLIRQGGRGLIQEGVYIGKRGLKREVTNRIKRIIRGETAEKPAKEPHLSGQVRQ